MTNVSPWERAPYVSVDRIRRAIDSGPYDAVIALSAENVPYFSGFYNMDLRLLPERMHIAIWPKGAEPAFIAIERRAANIPGSGSTFIKDVRGYKGEGLDSMRVLEEILRDRGLAEGRIGFEGRWFPGAHLLDIQRRLPKADFVDAYAFLESIRVIKSEAEVAVLARAAKVTCDAIDTGFRAARPGDTERAISARIQHEMLRNGIEMVTAPLLASGDRSGYWHGMALDRPVELGTVLKVDIGGTIDGYYSDIARTAVMGKATPWQRGVHAKLTDVKHRIVDAIKPGVTAGEVAKIGIQQYDRLGLEFKWFILGHNIGLGLHEEPSIYPWVTEPFKPGMTLMIEVGYNDDYPKESFHVEDLILVGPMGASYLTDATSHERIWELGV
jgi:Xaa-Pro aminopeptidase